MYKPISCVQTGWQEGQYRFPIHGQPLVKHWRCDLTALSHMYNLYFVACNDEIYVYEPSFPSQRLGEPVTILNVPASGVPVPPGIDSSDPHSITRVLVDYLGNEEVLLCTCDDGDVVGWRVREIHHDIVNQRDSPTEEEEEGIRCFIRHNVGRSAWGLAVHQNARLIAISANTHMVRVVAYGLSKPDDAPEDDENDFPFPRHQNRFITLRAQTNIPAVSFDNSGGDPTGRWLSSSSIDGLTHLWDLSNPTQPARIIAVGHCASATNQPNTQVVPGYTVAGCTAPGTCKCLNRNTVPHAAWAAIFVDPRSCHRVDSLSDACGPGIRPNGEAPFRKPCFWDITNENGRFGTEGRSFLEAYHAMGMGAEAAEDGEENDEDANSEGSSEMSIDSALAELGPPTELTITLETHFYPTVTVTTDPEATAAATDLEEAQPGPPLEEEGSLFVPGESSGSSPSLDEETEDSHVAGEHTHSGPAPHEEVQSDDDDDTSTSEDDPPHLHLDRSKKPYCAFITANSLQESAEKSPSDPRPLIIVTKEEIYLFQRTLDAKLRMVLTMRNPLYPPGSYFQLLGSNNINVYHRQCFTAQIPELGVFIVASPAGRVGVFRLTRTKYELENASELFGFRLDHLLPLTEGDGHKESLVHDVWDRQLIGVAVGPVQGMFDDAGDGEREGTGERGARRWRLMMYYHDHSVCSYELGKYTKESEVGLDELVV